MASIRERGSEHRETTWAVLYRQGGKQTSKTFATLKLAKKYKALVEAIGPDRALAEQLATDKRPDRLTVDQLATKFLDWKVRDVTERTMVDYRRDYANWVKPWLGDRAAETVDESDVQQWVDHMAQTLSPKSVADRHMLLHAMYKFGCARSRRLVEHNPCLETEMPRRRKGPIKGLAVPEYLRLLNAADRRNPAARDLILFLGESGWRFSEGIALTAGNVRDNGVDVWVTMTQVFRLNGSYRQVLAPGQGKSDAAFRTIRLYRASAAMIRSRVVGLGPDDLVLTNSRGRPWSQNTFLRDTWPKLLADAGLPTEPGKRPTPHWLRHMAVAVAADAGGEPYQVQRRIGHEQLQTTFGTYGGSIGDMSDAAIARASDIMSGKTRAPALEAVKGVVVSSESTEDRPEL